MSKSYLFIVICIIIAIKITMCRFLSKFNASIWHYNKTTPIFDFYLFWLWKQLKVCIVRITTLLISRTTVVDPIQFLASIY